ncbi:MAG: BON domain-containing protein [Rubrivivax sp.]|nr:BON domain-containing protein [Rubrivivax sp.]
MKRNINRTRSLALVASAAAALLLVACEKPPPAEPTIGQRIDEGIASAERKAAEAKASVEQAGAQAGQAVRQATASVADTARDAAITARVNAELARDSQLSALRINVDTVAGRVALNGTAPDSDSRQRAEKLAASVDGVVAVENRLTIAAKS